jgi:hypothetical protein
MQKHLPLLWAIFSTAFVVFIGYSLITNWEEYLATNKLRFFTRILLVGYASYQAYTNFKKWNASK